MILLRALGGLCDHFVDPREDFLERRGDIAVVVDIADELLREQRLAWVEVEQLDLFQQVIVEVLCADRHRLVLLPVVALLAHPARRLEAVEQDLLPVGFVVGVGVGLFHRDFR